MSTTNLEIARSYRTTRKTLVNRKAHAVHTAMGHEAYGDLYTNDRGAAAVQALAIWSMGGLDEVKHDREAIHPKTVRQAVQWIAEESRGMANKKGVVVSMVNDMLEVGEFTQMVRVPFRLKLNKISDTVNGKVLDVEWIDMIKTDGPAPKVVKPRAPRAPRKPRTKKVKSVYEQWANV